MDKQDSTGKKFCELLDIIKLLRSPEGCPWDKKQTVATFRPYLLEETHELLEALENDNPLEVKEELGDLFFQIGFINYLYAEKNLFSVEDVLQSIIDKMIRRHPHVFEGKEFHSYDEMRKNWAIVKEKENNHKENKSSSIDVPKSLPALIRGQKVLSRAARIGFDWHDGASILEKLQKDFQSFVEAVSDGDKIKIEHTLGHMLFTLVNFAREYHINSEECLKQTVNQFVSRFDRLEKLLATHNQQAGEKIDAKILQELWQETQDKS